MTLGGRLVKDRQLTYPLSGQAATRTLLQLYTPCLPLRGSVMRILHSKAQGKMAFKTSEVFVPGGMPRHTYIARTERDLEPRISAVSENLCKLAVLTGATKSGKTVLVNKAFPRSSGKSIWIDGGSVESEDDFWTSVLDQLDGHTSHQLSDTEESGQSLSGEVDGEIGIPLIAKGRGKVGTGIARKQASVATAALSVSPRAAAISQLRASKHPLVIDDFHYLPRSFQGSLIRALKPLVFDGQPVIVIAIPHRRFDAVKVEKEMTGRLESVDIPSWTVDELEEIALTGFPLLNLIVAQNVINSLASEAYGSPHLMQEFCKEICKESGVTETVKEPVSIVSIPDGLFSRVAEGTGRVVFNKLAKGPRQRTDRMQRALADGGAADIYNVVLRALAKLAPGMNRVSYEELRAAIKLILSADIPQGHEVTRVLEKLAEIAANDEASTPVIDWDKEDQELHVTDPFFAFFLKWGLGELASEPSAFKPSA